MGPLMLENQVKESQSHVAPALFAQARVGRDTQTIKGLGQVNSFMLYFGDLGFSEIKEWLGTTFIRFFVSRDFRFDLSMVAFEG